MPAAKLNVHTTAGDGESPQNNHCESYSRYVYYHPESRITANSISTSRLPIVLFKEKLDRTNHFLNLVPYAEKMYPNPQEKAVIEAAEKVMLETMAKYDPSHDRFHVQRVRKTALALAQNMAPTPDLLVVELAALLHDVLDKKYVPAEQASDPYGFFSPFFTSMAEKHGLDLIQDGRAKTVALIVDNVSWSTEKKRRASGAWTSWHDTCVELHCVQDADRLDAIGAFGIMRCAAYSSVTNRPLHTAPDDPMSDESAIAHFHDKLLHIHEHLKTAPGKKMGDKRHKALLDFLTSIDEEYTGTL